MNNLKSLVATILLVISTAVWAQSTDEQSGQTVPGEMPLWGPGKMGPDMQQYMMRHGWGRRMMNPQAMEQWMPQRHMPMMNYSQGYPMMPHMPGMGPGYGMPMMSGMSYGMMPPQMFERREQHMAEMQQTLKNIESLLQQILEQQKSL